MPNRTNIPGPLVFKKSVLKFNYFEINSRFDLEWQAYYFIIAIKGTPIGFAFKDSFCDFFDGPVNLPAMVLNMYL